MGDGKKKGSEAGGALHAAPLSPLTCSMPGEARTTQGPPVGPGPSGSSPPRPRHARTYLRSHGLRAATEAWTLQQQQ